MFRCDESIDYLGMYYKSQNAHGLVPALSLVLSYLAYLPHSSRKCVSPLHILRPQLPPAPSSPSITLLANARGGLLVTSMFQTARDGFVSLRQHCPSDEDYGNGTRCLSFA